MTRSARLLAVLAPLLVTSLAAARERPRVDALLSAPALRDQPRLSGAPGAFVASRDEKRGVPTFLWAERDAPRAASTVPEEAAREYLVRHAPRFGLPAEALATARVVRVHDIGRGGILVVFRQSIGGVELYHHDLKVLLDRGLRLVAMGGNLHAEAFASAKLAPFVVDDRSAVALALADLYERPFAASDLLRSAWTSGSFRNYELAVSHGIGFVAPAHAKRVYYPLPDRLVPAFQIELASRDGSAGEDDAFRYVIAADDGRVLERTDLTHRATYSYRLWAETSGDKRPLDGPLQDYTPYPGNAPNGSYPDFATPSLVSIDGFDHNADPWLPDGATETRGNNVDAFTDDDAPEGFSKGDLRASVTAPGVFDHAYDVTLGAQANDEQRMASVTSIFYVTNWLHDWWYDSGFDEKGHVAQESDYGRGSAGDDGDPLVAEAQFGAPKSRDNSNISVYDDGISPRMHMFVWTGKGSASATVEPGDQSLEVGVASFGPKTFDVTGEIAIVDDGTAPNDDACQTIQNDLTGKIALLQRGTCTFSSKVVAAAKGGAIGVLLYDDKTGEPPPPLGGGGKPAIGVLSLTNAAGVALEAQVAAGTVTAHLVRSQEPDRDGTIDNTVVAHEWGHYLHLRHVSCGSAMCAAESEGWADFNALHMVVREGDDLAGVYPLAQYATVSFPDDPAWFGIRRFPYSTDMTKNPLTFKHIADSEPLPTTAPIAMSTAQAPNSEAHAAGEVWAAMLWEAYAALLQRATGPNPPYTFAEARRRMSDYVVLGLSMAPTDPTYTEQRDAILAAAAANDQDDVEAMAAAFAKRGAGTCAVSPARDSTDFSGVVESFTVQPDSSIASVVVDDAVSSCDHDGHLDAGETGNVTVTLRNAGTKPLVGATATVTSTTPGVTLANGGVVSFPDVPPLGKMAATVQVALDPSTASMVHVDLSVAAAFASCTATGPFVASPLANYDEVKTGQTKDTVEAATTTWTLDGDSADHVWSRIEATPGNHLWSGVDYPAPSDTSLVSPPLAVSATDPFVMTFTHRHQFEASNGANYDGAVIEISSDGGKTWVDASMYGDPHYEGLIGDPAGQAHNALAGRQGYVDHNAAYPKTDTVTIDMGTSLAGQKVQVRFRIGSDDAVGAFGWELDDIAFSGITNAPFSGVVDDATACAGTAGSGGAGGASGAGGAPAVGGGGAAGGGGTNASSGAGGAASHVAGPAPTSTVGDSAPTVMPDEISGGGCSVGRGSEGAPFALFAALAALASRRRRRD